MPTKSDSKRSKTDALIEEGTFNPSPGTVRDPKFRGSEFFDPHDAVQVKYEMLRRVSIDILDEAVRERLVAMTADFNRLWADTATPNRERKRLLAHIIEDVTLVKLPRKAPPRSTSASRPARSRRSPP